MSINWVMLSADKKRFTPLPGEQLLWTSSSSRTTFSLKAVPGFPGRDAFSIESSAGTLYLTNRRIIFLPATPTPTFQSFASPILNLHDSHVTVPWFGANTWTAAVQPVPGGNLTDIQGQQQQQQRQTSVNSSSNNSNGRNANPSASTSNTTSTSQPSSHSQSISIIELKLAFKDGGAFDFHTKFEHVKERLAQVFDVARDSGTGYTATDVVAGNVHLDELPAYEATPSSAASAGATATLHRNDAALIPELSQSSQAEQQRRQHAPPPADEQGNHAASSVSSSSASFPTDAPPGYEEVQRASVADELERRLQQR